MIHCGKIPIYCAKSPIQCKITCCGQNCTLNVWLHHENHTLSCTFFVNYTTFVKYMDHFHAQSKKIYTWQKKLHRHRLWCLWQILGMQTWGSNWRCDSEHCYVQCNVSMVKAARIWNSKSALHEKNKLKWENKTARNLGLNETSNSNDKV